MTRLRFLFFVLVLLAGCSDRPEKSALVQGHIDAPVSNVIYFYGYADSADFFTAQMKPLDSAEISKIGNFSLLPELSYSGVFSLQSGGSELVSNLFLQKKDEVRFQFSGKEGAPMIISEGGGSALNKFLLLFQQEFYKNPESKNIYYIVANYMNPSEFETYTTDRREKMHFYFNQFVETNPIDEEGKEYVKATIDYEFGADRLMYVWKKRMKGQPVHLASSFFNFISPQYLQNEQAFISPSYIRFLNLYLKEIYEHKVETCADSLHESPSVSKYKLAHQLFAGRFRNAVLYNLIVNDDKDVKEHSTHEGDVIADYQTLLSNFKSKYHLN